MSAVYGRRIIGKSIYIPRDMLTESVTDAIYELQVRTEGIPDPGRAVEVIRTELPRKVPGLKVLWVRADDKNIIMQIQGSPFPWTIVLFWLPEILAAIGIIVVAIAVFLVVTYVPTWLWVMLAAGIGLIYLGPKIGSYIRNLLVRRVKRVWEVV